jgi:hypothetical protein
MHAFVLLLIRCNGDPHSSVRRLTGALLRRILAAPLTADDAHTTAMVMHIIAGGYESPNK